MTLGYRVQDKGILLKIKVIAHSSKLAWMGYLPELDRYKVKLTKPATDNLANTELIHFLSKHFQVPKKYIFIKSGEHSNQKDLFLELEERVFLKLLEGLP